MAVKVDVIAVFVKWCNVVVMFVLVQWCLDFVYLLFVGNQRHLPLEMTVLIWLMCKFFLYVL